MADDKKNFSDADRAELNSMLVNINRNGDGLVAYTLKGVPLPEEEMTAPQRDAVKRFAAIVFPPKEPVAVVVPEKKGA